MNAPPQELRVSHPLTKVPHISPTKQPFTNPFKSILPLRPLKIISPYIIQEPHNMLLASPQISLLFSSTAPNQLKISLNINLQSSSIINYQTSEPFKHSNPLGRASNRIRSFHRLLSLNRL